MKKALPPQIDRHLELRSPARHDSHAEITPEGAKGVIELAEETVRISARRA